MLHLAVVGSLLPQALHRDGIVFLQDARALALDPERFLYPWLVRLAQAPLDLVGVDLELAARLVSAAALSGAFVLAWRRFERWCGGAGGVAVALLTTTSLLAWRQGGAVEPTSLALLAVLVAAHAAEAFSARPSAGRAALAGGAALLALGVHLACSPALLWIAYLAWPERRRPSRRHATLAVAGALLALFVLAVASEIRARTFLSDPAALAGLFSDNLAAGLGALGDGAPLAVLLGLTGALACAFLDRRRLASAALLAAPVLLVLAVRGRPGVLLAVLLLLALAEATAGGLGVLGRAPRASGLVAVAFTLLLSFQVGRSALRVFRAAAKPDVERETALAIGAALPDGAFLFAGPLALHVDWFTGRPVLELRALLHDTARRAGGRAGLDAVTVIEEAARRRLAQHAAVYVTSEGLDYAERHWGADPGRLPRTGEGVLRIEGKPEVALIPLTTPATGR